MIKKISLITVITINLYSNNINENSIFVKDFFTHNKMSVQKYKRFLNDSNLVFANEVLAKKNNSSKVKIPNYTEAIKYLQKSIKSKNPIAAYEFIYIVDSYYKVKNSEIENSREESIKLLYKYEVCEGYLKYGDLLVGKKNYKKAIQVYKKGVVKCKEGYFSKILPMKLNSLKYQLAKGYK